VGLVIVGEIVVRIAVLILAILGILFPGFFGLSVYGKLRETQEENRKYQELKEKMEEFVGNDPEYRDKVHKYDRACLSTYCLLAAVPLGIFGAVLAFLGRGLSGGLVLIVAFLGPVVLAPIGLLAGLYAAFMSPLLIGGGLAFLCRPPEPDEDEERPTKRRRRKTVEDD
jgi:hypothetical protein